MTKVIKITDKKTKKVKRGHPPKYYWNKDKKYVKNPSYRDSREGKRKRREEFKKRRQERA